MYVLTILLSLQMIMAFPIYAFGQQYDDIRVGQEYELTDDEANHLNLTLNDKRGDFDFIGKKVGFAIGSSNYRLRTKEEYFTESKKYQESGANIINYLIILNDEEKIQSGGIDVIIISWSKIRVTEKAKSRLIIKIKESLYITTE
jgi:hypothetical protein